MAANSPNRRRVACPLADHKAWETTPKARMQWCCIARLWREGCRGRVCLNRPLMENYNRISLASIVCWYACARSYDRCLKHRFDPRANSGARLTASVTWPGRKVASRNLRRAELFRSSWGHRVFFSQRRTVQRHERIFGEPSEPLRQYFTKTALRRDLKRFYETFRFRIPTGFEVVLRRRGSLALSLWMQMNLKLRCRYALHRMRRVCVASVRRVCGLCRDLKCRPHQESVSAPRVVMSEGLSLGLQRTTAPHPAKREDERKH